MKEGDERDSKVEERDRERGQQDEGGRGER